MPGNDRTGRPNAATIAGKSKRVGLGLRLGEAGTAFLFLLPSLVIFAAFWFYPLAASIVLSLHLTDPRGRMTAFVGLENFRTVLTDPYFLESLKTTALFTLFTVPPTIGLALLAAFFTHVIRRGKGAVRWMFALPMAFSVGTASVVWGLLFNPSVGLLNALLGRFGLGPVFWLSEPGWALFSVSLVTVWLGFGFAYVVLLGGMATIPEEIEESARLDGAGLGTRFFRIVLPLVSPQLFFLAVVSVIGALQAFGQIHLLTQGGPMNATNVYVYNLYLEAFRNYRFGTASAMALLLFGLVLGLTLLQFRRLERRVHYR
ncbi:carbohydrate ABC transporter permease [Hydrogenibacillus schlegelii]|nr:sugar ABC transporter permease [Hydrogenibacillus schlegelii]